MKKMVKSIGARIIPGEIHWMRGLKDDKDYYILSKITKANKEKCTLEKYFVFKDGERTPESGLHSYKNWGYLNSDYIIRPASEKEKAQYLVELLKE